MITNYAINEPVWTILHPRRGYLTEPKLDYIQEICTMSNGVILQRHNSIGDGADDHWENDFYGNLVTPAYLYNSYEEAAAVLRSHYESEMSGLKVHVARIESILRGLQDGNV